MNQELLDCDSHLGIPTKLRGADETTVREEEMSLDQAGLFAFGGSL